MHRDSYALYLYAVSVSTTFQLSSGLVTVQLEKREKREGAVKGIYRCLSHCTILGLMGISIVGCDGASGTLLTPQPIETRTPTAVTSLAPAPISSPASSPTGAPPPSILRVANTGGQGVYIRPAPDAPERIRAWPEGSIMVVVGQERAAGGLIWTNVKDPDGNVGWVASDFLVEAAPTHAP